MQIKKKTMKREEWDYIKTKRYITKDYPDKVIGLIIIDDINRPLIVEHDQKKLTIIEKNYKWLEVAPKKDNYFMTAMFDENDELIEIYFDINSGNFFEDIQNPFFYDMFVDLCITKDNSVDSMDEEELKKAYSEHVISDDEYNQILKDFNNLKEYLNNNKFEIVKECKIHYKSLRKIV